MDIYFERNIDKALLAWTTDQFRKPLLLRGARQVGKSSAVRHLGQRFKYFLEINLERDVALRSLFEGNLDVRVLCRQLSAIKGIPVIEGQTLLFIDEIQESPRAIASLRYFYEEYRELHVVAAGSLLEFAINDDVSSFGVGRLSSLYMYPFSFDEFLEAMNLSGIVELKKEAAKSLTPLPEAIHQELVKHLKNYYLIGGMPEAVVIWNRTGDYSLCSRVHQAILSAYADDFSKYHTRVSPSALRSAMKAVAREAGCKMVYSRMDADLSGREGKEALRLLTLAGVVVPVTHSAANGLPLGAESNFKFQKYLFMDVGLMQSLLGMSAAETLLSEEASLVNRGALAEVFVGLEITKYASATLPAELYYWQRIQSGALAEVDYLTVIHNYIIPVEVKSGGKGAMQSLRIFMELKHSSWAIRTSLEPFATYDKIFLCPLYAVSSFSSLHV